MRTLPSILLPPESARWYFSGESGRLLRSSIVVESFTARGKAYGGVEWGVLSLLCPSHRIHDSFSLS